MTQDLPTNAAGFSKPKPTPTNIENVKISWKGEVTWAVRKRPTKVKELPIITKLFAVKFFNRNPVAKMVKVVKNWKSPRTIVTASFSPSKSGSSRNPNVGINDTLKIWKRSSKIRIHSERSASFSRTKTSATPKRHIQDLKASWGCLGKMLSEYFSPTTRSASFDI